MAELTVGQRVIVTAGVRSGLKGTLTADNAAEGEYIWVLVDGTHISTPMRLPHVQPIPEVIRYRYILEWEVLHHSGGVFTDTTDFYTEQEARDYIALLDSGNRSIISGSMRLYREPIIWEVLDV